MKFVENQMPAALELLRQMVGINSFTGNRDGVNKLGRFTADCFAPLDFTAESVPSVNRGYGDHLALTRRGRGSRSIAMVSHLDTVFPPEEEARNNFHWQPEGDRIYGPGAHDIKGGTVMMWLVLQALREQAPKVFDEITWKLFWNSSEETLAQDFGDVCRSRFDNGTLAALVFESEGRLGEERLMVVARKGMATWRVIVTGRGAHAGAAGPEQVFGDLVAGETLGTVDGHAHDYRATAGAPAKEFCEMVLDRLSGRPWLPRRRWLSRWRWWVPPLQPDRHRSRTRRRTWPPRSRPRALPRRPHRRP